MSKIPKDTADQLFKEKVAFEEKIAQAYEQVKEREKERSNLALAKAKSVDEFKITGE